MSLWKVNPNLKLILLFFGLEVVLDALLLLACLKNSDLNLWNQENGKKMHLLGINMQIYYSLNPRLELDFLILPQVEHNQY